MYQDARPHERQISNAEFTELIQKCQLLILRFIKKTRTRGKMKVSLYDHLHTAFRYARMLSL